MSLCSSVFVLLAAHDYEGAFCVGVYSTREAAKAAAAESGVAPDNWVIEERTVDASPEHFHRSDDPRQEWFR